MCLNIGTPKKINFQFETNGKLMVLGVPILKHFRVTTRVKILYKFHKQVFQISYIYKGATAYVVDIGLVVDFLCSEII